MTPAGLPRELPTGPAELLDLAIKAEGARDLGRLYLAVTHEHRENPAPYEPALRHLLGRLDFPLDEVGWKLRQEDARRLVDHPMVISWVLEDAGTLAQELVGLYVERLVPKLEEAPVRARRRLHGRLWDELGLGDRPPADRLQGTSTDGWFRGIAGNGRFVAADLGRELGEQGRPWLEQYAALLRAGAALGVPGTWPFQAFFGGDPWGGGSPG